jgi:hypothetical protein
MTVLSKNAPPQRVARSFLPVNLRTPSLANVCWPTSRKPSLTSRRRGLVAVLVLAVPVLTVPVLAVQVLTGCSSKPKPKVADEAYPPYEGQLSELFDDHIDPSAVGLAMDGASPANDPLLRLRSQSADIVSQMKVQTVTRDSVGAKTTFVLSLQVGQPPLMPAKMEERSIELSIYPEMGAFGIVQSLETKLRGRTFIGFVKRFRGDDGTVLHWHLTADTEEVAQVIHEVKVLEELADEDKE